MAFTLKARIGRGRTTETFSARLSVGGEDVDVAVKRPRGEFAQNEAFTAAFVAWGEEQKQHEHENLVAVLEAGRLPEGAYVIMERVDGVTLQELLRVLLKKKRTMSMKLALHIAEKVAAGLAALHAKKSAHGALDPGEVLISYTGEVKLSDQKLHALDLHVGVEPGEDKIYRAPEDAVSAPADIYSLALVILESLIGRPVWTAPSMTVEAAVGALRDFTHVGLANAALTEDLTSVLLGSLQAKPESRVQQGGDVQAGLARIIKQHKLETDPKELAAFVEALLPKVSDDAAPTTIRDPAAIEEMERARRATLERLEGTSVPMDPELEKKALSRATPRKPSAAVLPEKVAPKAGPRIEIWAGVAVIALILSLLLVHMLTRTGDEVTMLDVQLSSDPPRAVVYIDGKAAGQTPLETTHPARKGEVELRFELEGYLPLEVTKKVQGATLVYEARLSPE